MADVFHFRRFDVAHGRSAMKIGTDAILLGALADVEGNAARILDAGCGCGVVGLMALQRNPSARVTFADIDPQSVEECRENLSSSPWAHNGNVILADIAELADSEVKFDKIISNPPFYHTHFKTGASPRAAARNAAALSQFELAELARKLLNPNGSVSLVFPFSDLREVTRRFEDAGFAPIETVEIRRRPDLPSKRVVAVFAQFETIRCPLRTWQLTMFGADGVPTPDFLSLTSDFYIHY